MICCRWTGRASARVIGSDETDGLLMVREGGDDHRGCGGVLLLKTLYFDELAVARKIAGMGGKVPVDMDRVQRWMVNYLPGSPYRLSGEQAAAVTASWAENFP
jgi:hypothetical protein